MKKILPVFVILLGLLFSSSAFPCNVPVFKYAFDRWETDNYRLLVLHNKPLSEEEKGLITLIGKKYQGEDGNGFLNLEAETIDMNGEIPERYRKVIDTQKPETFPSMILCYPETYWGLFPVWKGDFTKKNIELIADSPVRQEIAKRLRSNQSVVWVFLESGNKDLDEEKKALLEKELNKNAAEIELPSEDDLVWELDAEIEDDDTAKEKTEEDILRPVFSIVSMKRSDEKESLFIQLLLNSEKDLNTFKDQPIAFPMFGRGRILFALVGKGINSDMIFESCSYLTGACSCQVKAQNPGFDCLVQTDWDTMLVDTPEEKPEEPLVLTSVLTEERKDPEQPALEENPEAVQRVQEEVKQAETDSLLSVSLVIGAVFLGLVVIGSAVILRKKSGS